MKKKNFLDITDQICPMTFVKTKIFLENTPKNEDKTILIKGYDNFLSIKKSLTELNFNIRSKKIETKIYEIFIKN